MKFKNNAAVLIVSLFIFLRLLFTFHFQLDSELKPTSGIAWTIPGFALAVVFAAAAGYMLCDTFCKAKSSNLSICCLIIITSLQLAAFYSFNALLSGLFVLLGLRFSTEKQLMYFAPLFLVPATIVFAPSVFYSLPILICGCIFAEPDASGTKPAIVTFTASVLSVVSLIASFRLNGSVYEFLKHFGDLAPTDFSNSLFANDLVNKALLLMVGTTIPSVVFFLFIAVYVENNRLNSSKAKHGHQKQIKTAKSATKTGAKPTKPFIKTVYAAVVFTSIMTVAGYVITGFAGSISAVSIVIVLALQLSRKTHKSVDAALNNADKYLLSNMPITIAIIFMICTFAASLIDPNSFFFYLKDFKTIV